MSAKTGISFCFFFRHCNPFSAILNERTFYRRIPDKGNAAVLPE